jgi:hypothetical protein
MCVVNSESQAADTDCQQHSDSEGGPVLECDMQYGFPSPAHRPLHLQLLQDRRRHQHSLVQLPVHSVHAHGADTGQCGQLYVLSRLGLGRVRAQRRGPTGRSVLVCVCVCVCVCVRVRACVCVCVCELTVISLTD